MNNVGIEDRILNKAHKFSLSNEHFAKGLSMCVKRDGGIHGGTYIFNYRDNIAEYLNKGKKFIRDNEHTDTRGTIAW